MYLLTVAEFMNKLKADRLAPFKSSRNCKLQLEIVSRMLDPPHNIWPPCSTNRTELVYAPLQRCFAATFNC